ncbi:MAG: hypothetical protein K0R72_609 [Clostridia bacterium]|jgi:hypothetical protein|nr:hypothetical protein [Clostridia bacterium]
MKDLFFKIVIVISIVYIVITITGNIIINQRYREISKTDSNEILMDYYKFYVLKDIVENYNNCILDGKYDVLSNITLFDGRKDKNFYDELKNKSSLNQNSIINISEIKVLSSDVYKCNYSIKSDGKNTNLSVVVKLSEDKSGYRIINILI